ncbi:hypothetical protein [Acidocella sp.]|uniref:hypothetical protein n=1 Tax=Acidocella sp. TaxID=50710 RepID=UPI003CFE4CF0
MSESESEDEILDRIEEALRKIAGAAQGGKTVPASEAGLDREALAATLDKLIARLRAGLESPETPITE